jgi:hypothetical protein
MRQPDLVIAGPFETRMDAMRHAIGVFGCWPHLSDARKYRRGWYLLARSEDTIHVGSKAFRRFMKNLMRNARNEVDAL